MQVELPRYVWADTRFKKDPENPLLYRAFTKSYDPANHKVAPLTVDIDFAQADVNPRTARGLIAMSEISMISLPNLVAVVGAAAETVTQDQITRSKQTPSNFLADILDVSPESIIDLGEVAGMLTAPLINPFVRPGHRNAVKYLDLHSAEGQQIDIADRFVDFYLSSRSTVLSKAQNLSGKMDNKDTPRDESGSLARSVEDSVARLILSEELLKSGQTELLNGVRVDKGFVSLIGKLREFVTALGRAEPDWVVSKNFRLSRALTVSLWYTYYSEIASGMDFLASEEIEINHRKLLSHEHTISSDFAVFETQCAVTSGSSSIASECLTSEVADVEKLHRCPFFTNRGWLDTYLKISLAGM